MLNAGPLIVVVHGFNVLLGQRGYPSFDFRRESFDDVGVLCGDVLAFTEIGGEIEKLEFAALFCEGRIIFQDPSRIAAELLFELVRHSSGLVRVCGALPSHAADTSSPSSSYPLVDTPAIEQRVGSQSMPLVTESSSTRLAGTRAGQRTMNGTRTPPSYMVCLPPRKTPA